MQSNPIFTASQLLSSIFNPLPSTYRLPNSPFRIPFPPSAFRLPTSFSTFPPSVFSPFHLPPSDVPLQFLPSDFRIPTSHFPFPLTSLAPSTFYLPPSTLHRSPSAIHLLTVCQCSLSKGEASALVLALASRVYLAMVPARCSGGMVPLSRCSINASRTRQKCCSWVVLRVSGI